MTSGKKDLSRRWYPGREEWAVQQEIQEALRCAEAQEKKYSTETIAIICNSGLRSVLRCNHIYLFLHALLPGNPNKAETKKYFWISICLELQSASK